MARPAADGGGEPIGSDRSAGMANRVLGDTESRRWSVPAASRILTNRGAGARGEWDVSLWARSPARARFHLDELLRDDGWAWTT